MTMFTEVSSWAKQAANAWGGAGSRKLLLVSQQKISKLADRSSVLRLLGIEGMEVVSKTFVNAQNPRKVHK